MFLYPTRTHWEVLSTRHLVQTPLPPEVFVELADENFLALAIRRPHLSDIDLQKSVPSIFEPRVPKNELGETELSSSVPPK